MGKRQNGSKRQRKTGRASRFPKTTTILNSGFRGDDDLDDDIDAFHKQRDMIPLDIHTEDALDNKMDEPVFDFKGDQDEDEDEDEKDDNETCANEDNVETVDRHSHFSTKDTNTSDEDDEDDESEGEKRTVWGRHKSMYFQGDNVDFELLSSDDDGELHAEEEEVMRMQRERAKYLSMRDFGLEDSYVDGEKKSSTLEDETSAKACASCGSEGNMLEDIMRVKKDMNDLSKEEQMDVVYSSAPELVGLLSELKEATNHLEGVNCLLCKMKEKDSISEAVMHYLEVKKQLLLTYCQAITFYLILKSEGHSVHDHPVIERLVELKKLFEKIKQIDGKIPLVFEEILKDNDEKLLERRVVEENVVSKCQPDNAGASTYKPKGAIAQELGKVPENIEKDQDNQLGVQRKKMLEARASLEEKFKQKGICYNSEGVFIKQHNTIQPEKRWLNTPADYDDEVAQPFRGCSSSKLSQLIEMRVEKPTKHVSGDDDIPIRDNIGERRRKYDIRVLNAAKDRFANDYDVADQHDIETNSKDADQEVDAESQGGEDEFYKKAKAEWTSRLAARGPEQAKRLKTENKLRFAAKGLEQQAQRPKTENKPSAPFAVSLPKQQDSEDVPYEQAKRELMSYLRTKRLQRETQGVQTDNRSRAPRVTSAPETETEDGQRRPITHEMEMNRGLTRYRKKLTKNPRKKYKMKHQKAVVRRKGQVRDIRIPCGSYGGEPNGINVNVSHSIRFKY